MIDHIAVSNGAIILYRNGTTSLSYYYGIVRVYYNGWGNICHDYFYLYKEANVICHQLGYTGVSSYSRAELVRLANTHNLKLSQETVFLCCSYGTDSSSMKLNRVSCESDNYLTILQCSFSLYIHSPCYYNDYDATVSCCTCLMHFIFIIIICYRFYEDLEQSSLSWYGTTTRR